MTATSSFVPAPISFRSSAIVTIALTSLLTLVAWNTSAPVMWQVLTHGSDQLGYYQYLPAVLIEGGWEHMKYVIYLENGHGLNLFTMGVAMLQAPFFLLAMLWCSLMGEPMTGYELPFVFARLLATASYTSVGSVLLLNTLLRRFHWIGAASTVLLLVFGTSLYFYSIEGGGMSHAYSFFLLAAVFHLCDRMVRKPEAGVLVGLILCLGLVVLIRPLHAVAGLFALFYGSDDIGEALRKRIGWILDYPKATMIGTVGALLLWLPQLFYWHTSTGSWFVFTYGKKGEGFDWAHPHLLDTLFNLQNGWFIYTPLMAIVMALLLWQAWRGENNARLVLIIWALVWYVYSSWWCWWLGGAFGYRGFIEYYAFLSLPLAWGIERIRVLSRPWILVGLLTMTLLIRVNVRLSELYEYPWERPTWTWAKLGDAYRKALLR